MARRPIVRLALGSLLAPSLALVPASAEASTSSVIATKINAIRTANGLPKLQLAPRLSAAARRHSAAQARAGRLFHDGFAERIAGAGIPGLRTAGENVAWVRGCGRGTATRLVRTWMRSAPHRRNILTPSFRLIGVGTALRGSCIATYATTEFAG